MTGRWQRNAGLLALRAGIGSVLVAHGVQKLFGWLGGPGLEGTGAAFEQIGFTPGRQSALAAGLGETGGGLLIAIGLATPVAGAAAAGTMIPAATVHAPRGFFATGGGYEYPALLGVSTGSVDSHRPGRLVRRRPLRAPPHRAAAHGPGPPGLFRGLAGDSATASPGARRAFCLTGAAGRRGHGRHPGAVSRPGAHPAKGHG